MSLHAKHAAALNALSTDLLNVALYHRTQRSQGEASWKLAFEGVQSLISFLRKTPTDPVEGDRLARQQAAEAQQIIQKLQLTREQAADLAIDLDHLLSTADEQPTPTSTPHTLSPSPSPDPG